MKKLMLSVVLGLSVFGLQAKHGGHHTYGDKPRCTRDVVSTVCEAAIPTTVDFCPAGTQEERETGKCYTERVVRDYHCRDKETTYSCPVGTRAE